MYVSPNWGERMRVKELDLKDKWEKVGRKRGKVSPFKKLLSEVQANDQGLVPLGISRIEIIEQFPPLADKFQEG